MTKRFWIPTLIMLMTMMMGMNGCATGGANRGADAEAVVRPSPELAGTWHAEFQSPFGPQKYTFYFELAGGKYAGRSKVELLGRTRVSDMQKLDVIGKQVTFMETFETAAEPIEITFNGIVEGDTLQLMRKAGEFPARPVTAKRGTTEPMPELTTNPGQAAEETTGRATGESGALIMKGPGMKPAGN